eukprot:NODE_623_length_5327_cov_0.695103.p3 type:complete len:145 gc:universal NODE_623_length_5327_cov_0.695103:3520-3954(+)
MAVQFKIFSLAMKTISKPLVQSFKTYALHNNLFKNACIQVGQFMHRVEKVGTRRLNIPGAPQILPLSEERALENGASMLSEFILFSIAAGILVWENKRSQKSTLDKENKQEQKVFDLECKVGDLMELVLKQQEILSKVKVKEQI